MSSKTIGTALTPDEITEHVTGSVPEGVRAVWGADWEGNPVVRGVRGDTRVALVGAPGDGYWGEGPTVTMCPICAEIFYADHSGESSTIKQRHLSRAHGVSAALLP